MDSLSDATVVITGASSGIGLAAARAFAARGANVVLAARRRELLERAARDCEALGVRALAVPTDVTDPARVRELANAAAAAFGRIDVRVNNAGTSMWGPFEDIPLESQTRLIDLNLLGVINGCHAARSSTSPRSSAGCLYPGRRATPRGRPASPASPKPCASSSEVEVCCVYPAYVDTPTYLNSANYTGRVLRRLAARLGGRFLFRSGPRAPDSDGGLFETVEGRAEARGDWGVPERRRARRAAALGAVLAAGAFALFLSHARRAGRLARALRT